MNTHKRKKKEEEEICSVFQVHLFIRDDWLSKGEEEKSSMLSVLIEDLFERLLAFLSSKEINKTEEKQDYTHTHSLSYRKKCNQHHTNIFLWKSMFLLLDIDMMRRQTSNTFINSPTRLMKLLMTKILSFQVNSFFLVPSLPLCFSLIYIYIYLFSSPFFAL